MWATNPQPLDSTNTEDGTKTQPKHRLQSLDAYRGLVMLLLAFTVPNWGWQLPIIEANPNSSMLHALLDQTEHIAWRGITLWDMIQPSFMFMVGVSMAYSYASRQQRGDSFAKLLQHAIVRAIMLVLLGIFLRSFNTVETNWTFEDVVSQIGLGYVRLFLVWNYGKRVQVITAILILIICWVLYAAWPLPAPEYDWEANLAVEQFTGFWAHWNQNANPGHYFDQWFLNCFPRSDRFIAYNEGYNTLNFIPSLAVMILGLIAGEQLRSSSSQSKKIVWLVGYGAMLLACGILLDTFGLCPMVKKVWTSAFSLVSGGICLLILAILYGIIDVLGWRKWSYPVVVVGMNPLAMYCMTWMLAASVLTMLKTHLGEGFFDLFGASNSLLLGNLATGTILWLICWWMHKRSIYLRL